MDSDTCERIISKLHNLVSLNTNLGDFDIVYASGEDNVSPVACVEGNISIASWCVKHVYAHAYHSSLRCKQKLWSYDECESLTRWTQFCLLIRPEVTTFWNLRRALIKKGLVSGDQELLLTKLILSRKPKCIEAFYERQWLYTKVLATSGHEWIRQEIDLCTWATSRHQNNYHAWNHRLWLLNKLLLHEDRNDLLKSEFESVMEWAEVHVSEHSCMHYVNQLVERMALSSKEGLCSLERVPPYVSSVAQLYEAMLSWNQNLIVQYPGHETLFYARKSLVLKFQRDCVDTATPVTAREHLVEECLVSGNEIGTQSATKDETNSWCCDQPAFKRTCVENVSGDWASLVMKERKFAEACVTAATSDFEKSVAQAYVRTVGRFSV
ncbi:protein prenyltransferase alpha subunit repeat-containing protein 1-like [Hyalella azteca]|uniref:Protein prenyltransferase alpha subunit repeat-containing protein 1-like n=1 Tax=Hyalella azteca TaxID=294128 RepID=A0A8B7N6M6_HYAAZ|nr:protein prenyltransferase alpha subunit repeat-containing protein 1-like [Hyalella azteca]